MIYEKDFLLEETPEGTEETEEETETPEESEEDL